MRHRVGLAITIISLPLLLSSCTAAGDLGINWHGLLSQVINFSILLVILIVVGYKPIIKKLDERSSRIKESMEQAEKIKQDTDRTEQEVQKQIEEARKEGQNIVAQAAQIGERVKEESKQEARQEAEALIARARNEIQAESNEAIAQLRKEFVDVAILAAEKVINKSLDKKSHQQLIEEVLDESTTLKKDSK